jgi:hypothetical protein
MSGLRHNRISGFVSRQVIWRSNNMKQLIFEELSNGPIGRGALIIMEHMMPPRDPDEDEEDDDDDEDEEEEEPAVVREPDED